MPKTNNPLFRTTNPVEPEVLDDLVDDTIRADLLVMPFPGDKPLTRKEEKRLAELEGVVHTALSEAIIEAWYALREIQRSRLHRQTHTTFEDYVKERWDMARQTAYQYIAAADVIDNVRNCGQIENVNNCRQNPIPQNEAQARVLTKYSPEKQVEIWAAAVESAPEGRITANHIRQTARRLYSEKIKEKIKKVKKVSARAPRISEDFRAAFNAFLDQINAERDADWAHTSPDEVARHLRGLLAAVEAEL